VRTVRLISRFYLLVFFWSYFAGFQAFVATLPDGTPHVMWQISRGFFFPPPTVLSQGCSGLFFFYCPRLIKNAMAPNNLAMSDIFLLAL